MAGMSRFIAHEYRLEKNLAALTGLIFGASAVVGVGFLTRPDALEPALLFIVLAYLSDLRCRLCPETRGD